MCTQPYTIWVVVANPTHAEGLYNYVLSHYRKPNSVHSGNLKTPSRAYCILPEMRQQLQAMQIYATLKHANNAIVMQIYAIHLNACKRIFNIKLKAMMARVSSLGH